jgi:hypothetical protein
VSDPRKLPPEKAWELVEEDVGAQELDRIAALSDEELDAELRAGGVDPQDAARVGQALLDDAASADGRVVKLPAGAAGAVEARARAPRAGRRPIWVWAGGLSAAAALALVIATMARRDDGVTGAPPSPGTADARERAAALRRQAFDACNEGRWARCEEQLDDAKAFDPDGESDPRVQAWREKLRERPR